MTPSNTRPTRGGPVLKDREIFQSLSDYQTPKHALGASIGLHGVLLLLLLVLPLLFPEVLQVKKYRMTVLAPPPPRHHVEPLHVKLAPPPRPLPPPPIVRQPERVVVETPPPPPKAPAPAPKPEIRIAEVSKPAPPMTVRSTPFDAKPIPAMAVPSPPVVTNVFSTPTTAALTVPVARNTEVSGFGDTSASRDARSTARNEYVASAGFGDTKGSTTGGGRPGGTGKGSVGTLGGFDVGAADGVRGGTGSGRGGVLMAGFVSNAEAPKAATPRAQRPAETGNEKPVEILVKPRPDYTDEARKMRIEGEVLLRILFTSTGEARVLSVINGLGHGLNENAIRAAEQIRFKPAQRAGQAVDSTAIVHIVFQLAY